MSKNGMKISLDCPFNLNVFRFCVCTNCTKQIKDGCGLAFPPAALFFWSGWPRFLAGTCQQYTGHMNRTSVAEVRTKNSCRYAVADLQNGTSALPLTLILCYEENRLITRGGHRNFFSPLIPNPLIYYGVR